MPPSYLVDRKIPSTKNHFVALCQPVKALQPGEHYFQPHLPTLVKSTPADRPKVPPTLPSTQVISTKSTGSEKQQPNSTSLKRKQIRLDVFLPKKRARQAQTNPPTTSSSNSQPSTSQGTPSITPTTGPTSAQKCDTRKQHPSTKIPACPDSRPNDIFNYVNLPRDLSDSEMYEVI